MASKKKPADLNYPKQSSHIWIISTAKERFLIKMDNNMIIHGKFENGKYIEYPEKNRRLACYDKESKQLHHLKLNYRQARVADGYAIVPKKKLKETENLPKGVKVYERYSYKNDNWRTQTITYGEDEFINQILKVELRGMVNFPDIGTLMQMSRKWSNPYKNYQKPSEYLAPTRCYEVENKVFGKLKIYTDTNNSVHLVFDKNEKPIKTNLQFLAEYDPENWVYRHRKIEFKKGQIVTLGRYMYFQETYRQMPDYMVFTVNKNIQNDAKLLFQTASQLQHDGNFEQAITELQKALEFNQNDPKVLLEIGKIYIYNLNKPQEAINYLTKSIQADPSNDTAFTYRAHAYRSQKDFKSAHADYNKAIQLDPTSWYNVAQRGITYAFFENKKKKAVVDYIKAVELGTQESYVFLNGAEMLLTQNRINDCLDMLSKYEKTRPPHDDLIVTHYLKAICFAVIADQKQFDKEEAAFKKLFSITAPSKVDWGFQDLQQWLDQSKLPNGTINKITKITAEFKNFLQNDHSLTT